YPSNINNLTNHNNYNNNINNNNNNISYSPNDLQNLSNLNQMQPLNLNDLNNNVNNNINNITSIFNNNPYTIDTSDVSSIENINIQPGFRRQSDGIQSRQHISKRQRPLISKESIKLVGSVMCVLTGLWILHKYLNSNSKHSIQSDN